MTPDNRRGEPSGTGLPVEGRIVRLAELSYAQIDALDRARTVILFAASPLEEHGTHLPVGTDLFEAEFITEEIAKLIVQKRPGWAVAIGPSIPFGASAFDHAGTLLVSPRTVRNAVAGVGAALARHGFRYLVVTNAHGGPRHLVALEEAAAVVTRRFGVRMLSLSGPVIWRVLRGKFTERLEALRGRPFSPEEREALRGDAHAGLWETSLMLRARRNLVDPAYTAHPPMRFSVLEMLRKNYPLRLGNRLGYIGSPAAATEEFGELARRLLLEVSWEILGPFFDAPDESWRQASPLYRIPFLRSAFPAVAAACALLLLAAALALWFR